MKYIKTYEKIKKKYNIDDYVFVDFYEGGTIIAKILDESDDWDYYILLPDGGDDEINEHVIKRLANKTEIEIFNIKEGDIFLINLNDVKRLMSFNYLEQEDDSSEYIYYFNFENKDYKIYLKDIIRKANKTEIDSVRYNL